MPSFIRPWVVALSVLTFTAAQPALADSPTASKKKKKKADAEAAPAPAAVQGPSADKKDRVGPAAFDRVPKLTLEDEKKEELADQKRDEAIAELRRIISAFPDGDARKADALFQLSELYWEKQKYLFRKEMRKFQAAQAKAEAARDKGEKVKEPKEEHRESELYRKETMRLYETVLADYPAYERRDEVLFDLAYNLFEIGKKEQAVQRYSELIKTFPPSSKFVPDTYVQLGNYYFDVKNDLTHARENYFKAFKTPVPKIKSYALYKLAWCDYNDHLYEDALKKMQDVIELAEGNGKEMLDLKNEALNDLVLVYTQLDRPDDATAYFKRKASRKRQGRLVAKLAGALADAGHFESAIKLYRGMIDDAPLGADAPEYQQAVVKAFEGLRQRDHVKSEIKHLAETYRPGSPWWAANASKHDVLRNAFNVTEEAMRTVVTEYHQEAQKTKQVDTYRLARDIYKQYIDAFATSDDPAFVSDYAFNLRFYYAEILWALEDWEGAAKAYDAVIKFKIPQREAAKEIATESYRQKAAYDEVLAYEKLVKIERGQLAKSDLKEGQKVEEQKKKGSVEKGQKIAKRSAKELEEKAVTTYEQSLIAACDQYNKLYPGNADEIDVRYQAAVIYYDRNHFVDAAKRLGEIIMKWPEERRSQDAADLSMSVLEERQEWLELNKLARQFQANKKLAKAGSEFSRRVGNVVEGSQYKWVDEVVYKKDKEASKAADEFLKFVAEFPRSDNAERALTYAMIIFKDAGQTDRGVQTGERLLKEYPGSSFDLKARFTLAKFYEQTAEFEKSAKMYEAFVQTYDDETDGRDLPGDLKKDWEKAKKAREKERARAVRAGHRLDEKETRALEDEAKGWLADAQFNAGLWWEGLGQTDRAAADYTGYILRFKDRKDAPDILFNIGQLYEKAKRWSDAAKTFDYFLTQYGHDSRVSGAQLYLARYRILQDDKQLDDAKGQQHATDELLKGFSHLSPQDKQSPRVVDAYAHARFLSLDPLWRAYGDIKFTKLGTFKRDLAIKGKKIAELEKAYTDVTALGSGEWGIAAVTRVGLAYADFAQNITALPEPKGFDADQKELFRAQLEEKAQPLEDKAIEAFEKALAKAYELSVYNEWTLLAQEQINRYRPGAYPAVHEVPFQGGEAVSAATLLKATPDHPATPQAPKGTTTASRATPTEAKP